MFSEIWAPAAAVLETKFPGIPNVGDVTRLKSLPAVDLLTAGFPCQDLSQAGKTAGIEGKKSGLVGHVFRLIDSSRPKWVLLENVSFMLRLDRGSAMDRLVSAFEDRGYRWAYRVVNSLSFVPQRRARVFFQASLEGDPADILLVDDADPVSANTRLDTHAHGFYWTEGIRGLGWGADCVPTLKNGSTIGIPSPPAILLPNGEIVTPDIDDAERLQGFTPGWTRPAERVGRSSFRWSLVGNAVTKPVAGWIGKRLRRPGLYDRGRDAAVLTTDDWPRAARLDGAMRREVRISSFPTWLRRTPLTPASIRQGDGRISFAHREELAPVCARFQRSRPRPFSARSRHRQVRRRQAGGVDRSRVKTLPYSRPTDPGRSDLMRRVRQRKTDAEDQVANVLREMGLFYRRNVRSLPGSPDFANKSHKWAVFVNGCFWHHHVGCARATIPTRNRAYWTQKFSENRTRDEVKGQALKSMGFRVLVVWECEAVNQQTTMRRLSKLKPR